MRQPGREPDFVRGLVEEVTCDRVRPIHSSLLDESGTPVLGWIAVERERIRISSELTRGELVQRARMSDLVLRDRRERDVLLERGGDARPLGVAPAQNQLVVSDLQQFLRVHARASAFL